MYWTTNYYHQHGTTTIQIVCQSTILRLHHGKKRRPRCCRLYIVVTMALLLQSARRHMVVHMVTTAALSSWNKKCNPSLQRCLTSFSWMVCVEQLPPPALTITYHQLCNCYTCTTLAATAITRNHGYVNNNDNNCCHYCILLFNPLVALNKMVVVMVALTTSMPLPRPVNVIRTLIIPTMMKKIKKRRISTPLVKGIDPRDKLLDRYGEFLVSQCRAIHTHQHRHHHHCRDALRTATNIAGTTVSEQVIPAFVAYKSRQWQYHRGIRWNEKKCDHSLYHNNNTNDHYYFSCNHTRTITRTVDILRHTSNEDEDTCFIETNDNNNTNSNTIYNLWMTICHNKSNTTAATTTTMTNNADNTMMMPTLRWCDRHNCKMNHWCLGWDDLCMRWADRDLNRTIHSLLYRDEPAMVCSYVSVRGNRFNHVQLSSCARRVRDSPNAGGCSILSEIFSCEIVRRWLGAKLVFTEMEVPYSAWRGPMTDYICEIGDGLAISVSVTRAMTAPNKTYTRADARRLLCKKMRGIIGASKRIRLSNNDEEEEEEEEEARNLIYTSRHCRGSSQLYKQILHIWAPSGRVARMIRQEWRRLSRELIDTTLVVVSIVDQAWVFTNRV